MRTLGIALLAMACKAPAPGGPPSDPSDTDVEADVDTDVDSDTDADTDSDADTDTGAPPCDQDLDQDGWSACDDCDDVDPSVFPGAPERCDGVDGDCDGLLHPEEGDVDGDGAPDCQACDGAGFWEPTQGLSGSSLRTALNGLTSTHTCTSYDAERLFMFTVLDALNGEVECVYTGRTTPIGTTLPDPADMNTEHSWPQSQGAGTNPARCDLHHLYPVDADANSRRNNHPYGIVDAVIWEEGGARLGDDAGGVRVFEPRDAHKGNAARSMLWFSMRYAFPIEPSQQTLFQDWNAQDPVDARELDRTLAIAAHQGEPNPYVLCPLLVDRL